MNMHEHWRSRLSRSKKQKERVALGLRSTITNIMMMGAPLRVDMTRIAPSNGLDSDNMVSSMKYVRDAIAHVLGVDDKDARVCWNVDQRRGEWAVDIKIAMTDGVS